MTVKPYIILNTSRKHVNYEEVPMNKPYNIQNKNICNGIFDISFFKALLINEGETTQGVNGIRGETPRYPCGQDTASPLFTPYPPFSIFFSFFFHFHGLEICKTAIICCFLIA